MYYLINLITFSRILIGMILFLMLAFNTINFLSLILFLFAGISDYFDGYFARKYNLTSKIGEIFDPIADKLFVIFVFVGVSLALTSYLIGFLTCILISREIWVGALRDYNSRVGNTNATKVIFIAKFKTSIQISTLLMYLVGIITSNNIIIVIADISMIITVLITVYTGFIYTRNTFFNTNVEL